MIRYAAILLLLLAASCSPSREIAMNANQIAGRAREDLAAWHLVEEAHPDMADEASAGSRRAQLTIDAVDSIHQHLTGVEDQTPWWASMIGWVAAAAVVLAVAFILQQSGAFAALRIAIGWIPKRKVQEADLAVTMLDPNKPENAREYIAARRAADPEFNAAWLKAQGGK